MFIFELSQVVDEFYKKYGPELEFTRTTGSPKSGLLNSGMQLYWIKKTKPEIFKKIKYSMHLPQYLSYVFTGIPISVKAFFILLRLLFELVRIATSFGNTSLNSSSSSSKTEIPEDSNDLT